MNDEIFDTSAVGAEAAAPAPTEEPKANTAASCEQPAQPAGCLLRCPRCGSAMTPPVCGVCQYDLSLNQPPQSAPAYAPYGSQPAYPQSAYPAYGYAPAQPKSRSWIVWLVCGLVVLFAILAAAVISLSSRWILQPDYSLNIPNIGGNGGYSAPSQNSLPNGVSQRELNQIRKDMSYALVTQIIGGEGTPVEEGQDIYGQYYVIYGWPGENNTNAVVYITFTDGCVTEVTSEGFDQ